MNTADLAENMLLAHHERRARAAAELTAAAEAPALFKPEWTARARRDLERATAAMDLWVL